MIPFEQSTQESVTTFSYTNSDFKSEDGSVRSTRYGVPSLLNLLRVVLDSER